MLFLAFVTLNLELPDAVQGQGTQEQFQHWRNYSSRVRHLTTHNMVDPNWVTPELFWYAVRTGRQEIEYVLIDAAGGKRRDGLSRERLREELLQVVSSEEELRQIESQFSERLPAQPPEGQVIGKRGAPTKIEFVNATDAPLKVYWLSGGKSRRPYGSVPARDSLEMSTYVGHAWMLVDESGMDRARFTAEEFRHVAMVNDETPLPAHRPSPNKRTSPGLSPDGVYDIQSEANRLTLILAADGTVVHEFTLEESHGELDTTIHWSPDSSKFIATTTLPGTRRQIHRVLSSSKSEGEQQNVAQGELVSQRYDKPGDRLDVKTLFLFHVDQDQPTQIENELFPNPFRLTRFRWSEDSKRFTFVYNERGHQILRLIGVDGSTGETSELISEASDTFICYSQNFYLKILDDTDEAIWMTERDGWAQLDRVDLTTGERFDVTRDVLNGLSEDGQIGQPNWVTQGQFVVRGVDKIDLEERQIWIRVSGIRPDEDPYHLHLIRVGLDGQHPVLLTHGDGSHTWQFSPDGRFLIDRFSRVDLPDRHVLRDASDGTKICDLETANVEALLKTGWRPPERFSAPGRDRTTKIHGIIVRPIDFDPRKKYPVVEVIYAGPHGSFVPKQWGTHDDLARIAELGFIVVKIDGMGTNHRGKDFHDVCWQNLSDSGFPDRIAWIRAAAETRPEMDLTRVGIMGGSAGGQSAMRALIDHGEFYHVAVADCGCHDNRVDKIWWNEQWMGWPIGPQYQKTSNVEHAHRLRGDLMLIVGENDRNVDPISTMQVVDALIKADKDFELLVMPGVGHGAAEHPYASRRRADFLVRKLWKTEPRAEVRSVAESPTSP